jgi:hypothetical protein
MNSLLQSWCRILSVFSPNLSTELLSIGQSPFPWLDGGTTGWTMGGGGWPALVSGAVRDYAVCSRQRPRFLAMALWSATQRVHSGDLRHC